MELTTHLELQSQTTRLLGYPCVRHGEEGNEAITLYGSPFQEHLPSSLCLQKHLQTTILVFREILIMSFSLFTRSY
jgi:hypothetical protein